VTYSSVVHVACTRPSSSLEKRALGREDAGARYWDGNQLNRFALVDSRRICRSRRQPTSPLAPDILATNGLKVPGLYRCPNSPI
jgi:hypothetical protein